MDKFQLIASPWWVNLFLLVPFLAYYIWRGKIKVSRAALIFTALFGIVFGYVEAAVVVYLRVITGSIHEVLLGPNNLTKELLRFETFREIATIVMIFSVTLLAAKGKYTRWAIFFWVFAFWDIFYYIWLKVLIGWPQSLTTQDVLFLIPAPWYSQVWLPISISLLLIVAVVAGKKSTKQ